MQQRPQLLIPAFGALYRMFAPITEPLIRVTAGASLAIHGYPILFGNKAGAAKFLASVGFQDGLFWTYIVGTVEFVCGLCLALGLLTSRSPPLSAPDWPRRKPCSWPPPPPSPPSGPPSADCRWASPCSWG